MRTLLYVPIIHMDVDLGSLSDDLSKIKSRALGEELLALHRETVSGFWDSITKYFEGTEVKGLRIYQDGMVANGEMGQKIIEEALKVGSKNHELLSKLISRGAILERTEDINLVREERDWLIRLTRAGTAREKLTAYLKYRFSRGQLLMRRDRFIADTINRTLRQGETGVLFIGAHHNVLPHLNNDIRVKEIKERRKILDYHNTLHKRRRNGRKLEALSKYLIS